MKINEWTWMDIKEHSGNSRAWSMRTLMLFQCNFQCGLDNSWSPLDMKSIHNVDENNWKTVGISHVLHSLQSHGVSLSLIFTHTWSLSSVSHTLSHY